jgi:hypothetical protein
MKPKFGGFPNNTNHPVWTCPYYGVQHRKNTSKSIQITVVEYDTGAVAYLIEKDLKKHLSESNFTSSKEVWCVTVEEARTIAETWN